MMWTLYGTSWTADDGSAGPPPGLPAKNGTKAWKSGDRYDDAPAPVVAQPVAPYTAGTWNGGEYCLTHVNSASYSIVIDGHQKKHIGSWPGSYHGAAGTKFPLNWTNADVIAYAQLLLPSMPVMATTPATNHIESNVTLAVTYAPPGGTAKKPKLPVASVIINGASWNAALRMWSFHFYKA
jgi:hypothetical protein